MTANFKENVIEPIRGSTFLLIVKLLLIMFIVDTLHSLLSIFLFDLPLLAEVHYQLVGIMFITHFLKNIFKIYLVISVVLHWIGNTYYLTEEHFIKREGVLNITEKIYDLKIIRSVSIIQGIIGKILNYGDIKITTSASGGYNDEIYLSGISHPEKYEGIFKHCLGLSN